MRYALVTGGSRGIGRAICIKLAAMGYPVVINYLGNQEAAEATKSAIEQMGGTAQLLRFDISNPQAIEEAIEMWENSHPNDYIAVLVNNAGIRRDNLMVFMQNSEWHNVIDTTLNGFFYTTRRVLKGMMTKRFGRIINITSLSGLKGMPGQCNYSAAKAALIGATKALAQEVAPRKVTVNAVAPGFIESDMTKELPKEELAKMVPMKRFGKPEEVASLVGFLAGEESSYITGEVISINGGLL
ncbi:MAG: 3-oxoacyl-ACP reductase FabG [Candidatus Egerieousia sp.]|nr:3-oxoacyl-ACP reductase FabG [bacterium]MDY2650356.1 3-oxoacyl-ACP reductase FabG [Candidatus Egerieousia sp.]MDD7236019.1 3-oxoacyl-ACP reductase FabG [bacterium]MDY3135147.1 3-oxoacyl-ACP reductase FabG [Candidatus Egerieousia sp.]MDY3293083.1 3-oxoacyl-ACP reductase FabG [Candidatus Egerieousia sp.]